MNGYIKIGRGIMDWEWWDDDNMLRLWLTILIMANWEDKEWRGKTIPRGSLWTSYRSLAKKTGLTVKQIRNGLGALERAHQVTLQRAHDGTLISIVKYEDFQDKPKKKGTPKGTQKAREGATTEEIKNKYIWGQGGIHREYC